MTKFLEMADAEVGSPGFGGFSEPVRRSGARKVVLAISAVLLSLLVAGSIAGYFYWQSFKSTPQYSLALLVDAARRDDQSQIDQFVSIDAVVDEFMPQITGKAVELYGRGLPAQTLARVERVARPLMPALKQRARAQLPALIRKKTERFESVPFAAMVLGAGKYLDIRAGGDTATVRSKLPEHSFEVRMQRNGSRWTIVGMRDEALATEIAQKVGQEIIAVASNGGADAAGDRLGIRNLNTILQQAEEIFR
ncbi:MAG TPA: hypothetical protein VMZ26_09465 [Pyrinomonadaceae bacterium]|nr:hypothetical protein [Pyrinomonadaceae bacterium]